MTNVGSSVMTKTNTSSGYMDGDRSSSWIHDAFGDNVTYSTNTLDAGVTVTEG